MAGEGWVVVLSREGKFKRMPLEAFSMQHRGGKGIAGARPGATDIVDKLALLGAGEDLMVLTSAGRCVGVAWDKVPEMGRYAQGTPVATVFPLEPGEKVSAFMDGGAKPDTPYLVVATSQGIVKRTEYAPLRRLRAAGIRVITLSTGDEVIAALPSPGDGQILLATRGGRAVRFDEQEVRVTGRESQGVTGIRLEASDRVASLSIVSEASTLLTITEMGFGKRSPVEGYRKTSRGTQGVTNIGDAGKVGAVVDAFPVGAADQVLLASQRGNLVRVPVGEIRETGRSASGVHVMRLDEGDRVTAAAVLVG